MVSPRKEKRAAYPQNGGAEVQKAWAKANAARIQANTRARRAKDPEKFRAKAREYYANHKERFAVWHKVSWGNTSTSTRPDLEGGAWRTGST